MTIIKLFEAQAARTPDAIAVRFENEDLTYAQLNERANQLAHFLQSRGVEKEQMVGLFLERSLEMLIGILGVLKASGAYVPVDPDYPAERVAFMLGDTQIRILLTQSHLFEKLPSSSKADPSLRVICLDSDWTEIATESAENPVAGPAADTLAYTIYTSGSTGKPKGVMNEHRGIYNRLVWMLDVLPLTENDRVVQKTPYSFDVSIWEFFWPLLSGARLVIAKPGGHKDNEYLVNLIVEEQITAIHFVPSMLQVFLLHEGIERCRSLQRVFCSGEALSYELQERFFSRLDAELYNLYGPTEAAIEVTFWACQRDSSLLTVPIGQPLPNTQIHILDSALQPAPDGESGELHIGGVQVARGYLNRPDLTAERFIPDPFRTDPTARLYKTGDLASRLPDGTILYHGRLDHQVKIRGNRVELGEIEATLAKHPAIREAVVVAYEAAPGDKRLAAYIIPERGELFSLSKIRDFLAAKLPEYMMPSTFNLLESLPLTPSGKVNRQELPVPNRARPGLSENYVAPRNSTEEILASIWESMIGLDRVGIHDNFLELGGDSILCIQITSRANQAGLHLTSGQVLQYPTIAELAAVAGTVPIAHTEQETVTGFLPLTPAQKQLLELDDSDPRLWNQTFVLEVHQTLNASLLEKAVKLLLIHHDALRLRFIREGANWNQEITLPDGAIPLTHIRLYGLTTPGEQKSALGSIVRDLQNSLDLSKGLMLRTALVDVEGAASYFLLVVNSLAIDGISWRILLEHLDLLYQQLSQNQQAQLPLKTTSYKYWAQQLKEFGKSDPLQQELPFWLAMHGAEAAQLPVDSSEGNEDAHEATTDSVSVSLSIEETRSLMTEVPKVYRTLMTDVLFAALAEAFFDGMGKASLQVDIEGHGREAIFQDVDLSRTVGCFSAIYPVVLHINDSLDSEERLMAVKEQLRQVPHGGIGYGVLRHMSEDEDVIRRLHSLPQSEIRFTYMGQVDNILNPTSIFMTIQDVPYPQRHPLRNERYRMEITAAISRGQLHLTWAYNRNSYERTTIQRLARSYLDSLQNLIAQAKSAGTIRYTPTDFPEANLSQQELDDLLSEIDGTEG